MANVILKINPENLIKWSNFEDWTENGTSAAPTGHTLSGASATVARQSSTIKEGSYSAGVTRVGADATLYHDYPDYLYYLGRKMTFGCWVYATVASRARIAISDGVGTTTSSYHTGGSGWEYLTVTRNIDTSATRVRVEMQVNTGNTTAYFDGGILCEGDTASIILTDYADIGIFPQRRRYRIQEYDVVRRDGPLVHGMNYSDFYFNVEGQVLGATATSARTNLDTLAKAIHPFRTTPEQKTSKHDLFFYDDRYTRVLIGNFDVDPTAASRILKFKAKMVAIDPFQKYVGWLRSKTSLSASPTTLTLTVSGNMYSLPIITFTPAGSNMTSCILENLTTGESFNFSGTVTTATDLIIDNDVMTVENNSVYAIASFAGDFMRLLPGGNELKFTGTTGGILRIDWQDRWI